MTPPLPGSPSAHSLAQAAQPRSGGWHVWNWLRGGLLATLLMGVGAGTFLDSIGPFVLDPQVGRLVAPPGHHHRFRSEGWAVTRYGRFGVAGIPDIRVLKDPKVAIWGDSFVEGMHVADRDKMAQQLTALWQEQHATPLVGVGIGGGDRSISDYYFLIPRYERITPLAAHCIVLASLRDVCPDGRTFLGGRRPRLVERRVDQPWPGLRGWLDRAHLAFLWGPFWSLWGQHQDPLTQTGLRLRPGPAAEGDSRGHREDLARLADPAAWDFLLDALKEQTRQPIFFIYAPPVPVCEEGHLRWTPPEVPYARTFAACCRRAGVGFVDMTQSFVDSYRRTGCFPRGFANSIPGRGHLNRQGHRLVAQAICQYLDDLGFPAAPAGSAAAARRSDTPSTGHRDAVHPD